MRSIRKLNQHILSNFRSLYGNTTPNMALKTPEEVLQFWFGNTRSFTPDFTDVQTQLKLWFHQAPKEFEEVQISSASLIEDLANRDLEDWDIKENPKAALAKVIVLDQFSRCAFRGSNKAFSYDEQASDLVQEIVRRGWFLDNYFPIERIFLCVCLQHSEVLSKQELGMEIVKQISQGASGELGGFLDNSIPQFQRDHYEVVRQFGRYPHRNVALGRTSTPEEIEWLNSPNLPGWAKSQKK